MDIKTKFDFGQRVWGILKGTEEYRETCKLCKGNGRINITPERTISCPDCYGHGFNTKWKEKAWFIPSDDYYCFVIQKIAVELYNPNNKSASKNRSWIYYMAASSGTMFDENNLFSSIEEAQLECDKRNNKKDEVTN